MLSSERTLLIDDNGEEYSGEDELSEDVKVNMVMLDIERSLKEKIDFAREYRKGSLYQGVKDDIANGRDISIFNLWVYLWVTDDNPQELAEKYKNILLNWYDHEMNCAYNTLCEFFSWESAAQDPWKGKCYSRLCETLTEYAGKRLYMSLIPINSFENEQTLTNALDLLSIRAAAKSGKDYLDYLKLMASYIVYVCSFVNDNVTKSALLDCALRHKLFQIQTPSKLSMPDQAGTSKLGLLGLQRNQNILGSDPIAILLSAKEQVKPLSPH